MINSKGFFWRLNFLCFRKVSWVLIFFHPSHKNIFATFSIQLFLQQLFHITVTFWKIPWRCTIWVCEFRRCLCCQTSFVRRVFSMATHKTCLREVGGAAVTSCPQPQHMGEMGAHRHWTCRGGQATSWMPFLLNDLPNLCKNCFFLSVVHKFLERKNAAMRHRKIVRVP